MYHKRFNFITLNTSEVHTSKVLLRKDAKRTLLSRLEYLDRATQNANVLKKYIEKSRKSEKVKITIFFFFLPWFSSQILTTHRTAGVGSTPPFIPLYHFHPLTNIETFICNFACEMTITYF